jgi:SAM-dependent methyltransferase
LDRRQEIQFAALPPLNRANAARSAILCKICGAPAMFFDVVDFQKGVGNYEFGPAHVPVSWYRCCRCDFLFTPFADDWSKADFARFIYNDDYIKVDPDYLSARPRAVASYMATLLTGFETARILDYGAGRGGFAASMAELGFRHVESYDPFSMPERPVGSFDIVICNEVIQHSPFPGQSLEEMRSMLRDDGCIVLGECLQPPDIGQIRCNWWYVAPRNGHISTFSDRTFAVIGDKLGMKFHRGGRAVHALCARRDGPFSEIAQRCGPSMMAVRLCAPDNGLAEGWSVVEDVPPSQFRWTTAERVSWQTDIPIWNPRCVQILVPFAHESRPGFAAGCTIQINGYAVRSRVQGRSIVAEADAVAAGRVELALRSPALTATGNRTIGIAVLIG